MRTWKLIRRYFNMVMSGLLCFKLILRINSKRKPKTLPNNYCRSHSIETLMVLLTMTPWTARLTSPWRNGRRSDCFSDWVPSCYWLRYGDLTINQWEQSKAVGDRETEITQSSRVTKPFPAQVKSNFQLAHSNTHRKLQRDLNWQNPCWNYIYIEKVGQYWQYSCWKIS